MVQEISSFFHIIIMSYYIIISPNPIVINIIIVNCWFAVVKVSPVKFCCQQDEKDKRELLLWCGSSSIFPVIISQPSSSLSFLLLIIIILLLLLIIIIIIVVLPLLLILLLIIMVNNFSSDVVPLQLSCPYIIQPSSSSWFASKSLSKYHIQKIENFWQSDMIGG